MENLASILLGKGNTDNKGKHNGNLKKEENPESAVEDVKGPNNISFNQIIESLVKQRDKEKEKIRETPRSIEALFIGSRGENIDFFRNLIVNSLY